MGLWDLLAGVADQVAALLGLGGLPTAVIVFLAAAVLYVRKALGLGGLLADWASKLMFALVVLIILLLSGVVPTLNLDRAIELVGYVIELVQGFL